MHIEEDSLEVIDNRSISFFDPSKSLRFTIEGPNKSPDLNIIFGLEKVQTGESTEPKAEKINNNEVKITIPVDQNNPVGGSTSKPAFVATLNNKNIYIHFSLEALQKEHFLLEYTLFAEDLSHQKKQEK